MLSARLVATRYLSGYVLLVANGVLVFLCGLTSAPLPLPCPLRWLPRMLRWVVGHVLLGDAFGLTRRRRVCMPPVGVAQCCLFLLPSLLLRLWVARRPGQLV